MKIGLYVLNVLGGKVTTQIVILQKQPDFKNPIYSCVQSSNWLHCNHGDLQQIQQLILRLIFQTRKC